MEKFKQLIGKTIDLVYGNDVINSYVIKELKETKRAMEGRGKMIEAKIDWKIKNVPGAYPVLDFDEQTLTEMIEKGISICPGVPNLYYSLKEHP